MTTYDKFKSYLRSRNYSAAFETAEREALKNPAQKVFWMNQQAIALINAGNTKEALEILKKALSIDPQNPWTLLFYSDARQKSGDITGALSGYEELLGNEKLFRRAQRGVLECLIHLGEWNKTLDCISQWNLPPEESYKFQIQALTELKRTDEAFSLCNQWLQISPDNKSALWHLVMLEISRDGLETVCLKYERLAKIPSKPPIYGEIHAYLCKKSGKIDKAVNQYQKLQTKTQDPSILRKKAFALAKSGQELQAIPLLEELLRISPADTFLHSSYSAACDRSSNLERAWKFYHELLSLNPDDMRLFGRIKKIQKKLEESSGKYSKSDPETPL
jgi:tetratricopeptide (TPR) repeat protein